MAQLVTQIVDDALLGGSVGAWAYAERGAGRHAHERTARVGVHDAQATDDGPPLGAGLTVAGVLNLGLELLVLAAAMMLHVVVHEAAHAASALALGIRVPEVSLGDGRSGLRVRLGGTTVRVGGFHAGATHLEPRSSRWLRSRLGLVAAAGPVSNLVLGGSAYLLLDPGEGIMQSFVWALSLSGLLFGVFNLLPVRLTTATGRAETDGRVLLSLLRDRRSGERSLAAGRLSAAQRRYRDGTAVEELLDDDVEDEPDRTDPVVLGMQATRRIFTGEFEDAVALLREAAAMPHDDHHRGLTLNNLAWALLLARPEGWLEEAGRASEEAMLLVPSIPALSSTRGCVLVHLDRPDEARALLRGVDRTDVAAPDLVILDHHLFLAEHRLGNLYGARAALLALVDDGAASELVDRARSMLRPLEVEHALDNLVGADALFHFPQARRGDEMSRHIEEIRSTLAVFVQDVSADPRQAAVRRALGD